MEDFQNICMTKLCHEGLWLFKRNIVIIKRKDISLDDKFEYVGVNASFVQWINGGNIYQWEIIINY